MGYEAGAFRTAPGVFGYDAKLCWQSGWLELAEDAIEDFDALTNAAADKCASLRRRVPGWLNWTFAQNPLPHTTVEIATMFAGASLPYGQRPSKWPTGEELDAHEMGKCALWDPPGLACDAAYCRYNYCSLPDGHGVGAFDEHV